jgi:SAM-dependent methyltransferase
MNWRQRSYDKELLDRDDIPFDDLLQNLKELDDVNTKLGGHATTIRGIRSFLDGGARELTIAEIGCGGGDNLRVLSRFLTSRNVAHKLIGIDLKPECIRYAQESQDVPVAWICSDYRTARWPEGRKPDVIFSSLFCHHFNDDEMVEQLQWLEANSRLGFYINDLHRHPVAYYAIKNLTRIFSKSYLVKNDAPLSVRRGFQKWEWLQLFRKAGLALPHIQWRWAFRYLVIWKRND